MDELYELMKADADLDNEVNPSRWGQTGRQTFEEAIQILLNEYSKPRREWLYGQAQPDDSDVRVILSGEPGEVTARYFVPDRRFPGPQTGPSRTLTTARGPAARPVSDLNRRTGSRA